MAKYRITAPDGGTYEVTAPEGASEADVMAYAQANYKQPAAANPFANVQSGSSTVAHQGDAMDAINASNRAYVGSERQGVDRGRQDAWQNDQRAKSFKALPAPMRSLIGAGSSVGNAAMGIGQVLGVASEAGATAQRQSNQFMAGDTAASLGRYAGDVAITAIPMAKLTKLAGVTKLARYGSAAAGGAAAGYVQPVAEGESRSLNTLAGGALGIAGQGAADVVGKVGKAASGAITTEAKAIYAAAKARGIDLTPAQLSNSKFLKFMQSQLGILPLSGAQARTDLQKKQFNRAVAKSIGEEADAVTPEVYGRAKTRQSQQFNELTGRNTLKVTDGLFQKLEAIGREAETAGGDVLTTTRAVINDFYERARTGSGGIGVPGDAYQAFDSQLGQIAMKGTPLAHFVGRVKSAVRSAMDDSISPADKKAWDALRKEYGNRKTIRDLVVDETGISPQALMGRVRANNYGKEAIASGTRGELGELAKIGQRMKEPASSGTAERSLVNSAINPLMWPSLAIGGTLGSTVGRASNSNTLASLMLRSGRGEGAQALAPYLRGAGVAAVPAVTPKAKDAKDSRKRP